MHRQHKNYELTCPEKFNFSYDIIDEIAKLEPNRRAIVWCNTLGEEKSFTYGDLKTNSDKVANMLRQKGIGKGDKVMLILKRHYQFWFIIYALHKLGAIPIPATFLLTKHDVEYRANSAQVKMIVCTADGDVAEHVDMAMPECPTVKSRIIVNGTRENWDDYEELFENAPTSFLQLIIHLRTQCLCIFVWNNGNPKMVLHKTPIL